ncbi:MAG: GntR family transcriptional regulator [Rubrobacter sp.]|jgi:DNA-binding GntR family transcriptional regulator|nr:GntR family transcriptional regulator [Rubrobacter sp.]
MSLEETIANASGRYRTTQSMVAGGLREAILEGTLEGGRPLRQEELADLFGVSRIPVREALRQLEGEGLVSFYPHRGAVVSRLSYKEVEEITDLRVALETMAMRKALPALGEEELERAEEVLHAIDTEKDLVSRWGELNWRFHATLLYPADRPRLLSLVKTQHTAFERYIRMHLALSDYDKPQREHYEMLEACRGGDTEAVLNLLTRHIEDISELLFEYLRETPEPEQPEIS